MTVKLTISALLGLRHRVGTIQKKGYDLLEHFLPHIHRTVDAVDALKLLFELLETYSPVWYEKHYHDRAESAINLPLAKRKLKVQ